RAHAELGTERGVDACVRRLGEEAGDALELLELAGFLRLRAQAAQRVVQHRAHPVPGEGLLGRLEGDLRLRLADLLEIQLRLAAAALACRGARPGIAQEATQRGQQVVAESAERRVGVFV